MNLPNFPLSMYLTSGFCSHSPMNDVDAADVVGEADCVVVVCVVVDCGVSCCDDVGGDDDDGG